LRVASGLAVDDCGHFRGGSASLGAVQRTTISAMAIAKKGAAYDDLLRLPEHVVGEIVDGDLIVSPRPALAHARARDERGQSPCWRGCSRASGSAWRRFIMCPQRHTVNHPRQGVP